MIPLSNVCTLSSQPQGAILGARRESDGWILEPPNERDQIFLHATALCGDAPHLYHPAFVAAILEGTTGDLADAELPEIRFTTDEAKRRSMTLNGMRMSIEFRQTGSRRVLELVQNRLAAGQNDSVHDVLVYLMRLVWDTRAEMTEAVALRSESLAAWLGLEVNKVAQLWQTCADAASFTTELQSGDAGTPRRSDIAAIVENQWELLGDDIAPLQRVETETHALMAEITALLSGAVDFDRTL